LRSAILIWNGNNSAFAFLHKKVPLHHERGLFCGVSLRPFAALRSDAASGGACTASAGGRRAGTLQGNCRIHHKTHVGHIYRHSADFGEKLPVDAKRKSTLIKARISIGRPVQGQGKTRTASAAGSKINADTPAFLVRKICFQFLTGAFTKLKHEKASTVLPPWAPQHVCPENTARPGLCQWHTHFPAGGKGYTLASATEVFMHSTLLLCAEDMERIIERLALQIIGRHGDCASLVLVGIQRRGVDLAKRLAAQINERLECAVPLGTLDINLYRDDWTSLLGKPQIGQSSIPVRLDDKVALLVDDVLFTGRTVRAALEALLDYGRPQKVELLALVDRGHRELPIHADYVGHTLETARSEHVNVLLDERDGVDAVRLQTK
jgi:pyrimidine operon attenuation protein/uracil phosphoribosyltransferase